jgi:uncharacterized membrane protein
MNGFELKQQFLVLTDVLAPTIFYFMFYSLIGWLLENTHSYFTRGTFIKPNFWFGPFKPMYGFAPLILIYSISNDTHWIIVLILCFFVPTVVEYISGVMLESLFHKKWWDYSGNQMHFQGHICLTYSVYWTFLSFLCISFIHPVVEFSYERIESYFQLVWPIIAVYCIIETFLSFWRHTLQNKSIETLG